MKQYARRFAPRSDMQGLIERCLPYARPGFFVALVIVTLLLLWPTPPRITPFDFFDKVEHAFTFLILTLLGFFAYEPKPVLSGLIAYGGVMEIMQQLLTVTRFASLADWVADTVGVLLAWALYLYWQKNHARI